MGARVNLTDLLSTLGRVEAGLSPRAFIEQSDCYIFRAGWVSTFNDEICCQAKSGLPKAFEGAVHGKPLVAALEAMTTTDVEIEFTDREMKVTGADEVVGVRLEREITLPVEDVTLPEEWIKAAPDFAAAIKKVADAAGTKDEEFLTVCVHVHPDYVEATDRKQLCRYRLTTGVSESFLVRAKSIASLVKLELPEIGQTDEWIHFRGNKNDKGSYGIYFSCRRHVENYYDLDDTFEFRGQPAKLPRGADKAADLAGTFCEGKDNDKVLVTLTRGKMRVRGEGTHGYAQKNLPMDYKGDDLMFRLSPAMLTQLVRDAVDCELDSSKLRIAGEKWTYIVGLGKPQTETEPEPEPEDADEGD